MTKLGDSAHGQLILFISNFQVQVSLTMLRSSRSTAKEGRRYGHNPPNGKVPEEQALREVAQGRCSRKLANSSMRIP